MAAPCFQGFETSDKHPEEAKRIELDRRQRWYSSCISSCYLPGPSGRGDYVALAFESGCFRVLDVNEVRCIRSSSQTEPLTGTTVRPQPGSCYTCLAPAPGALLAGRNDGLVSVFPYESLFSASEGPSISPTHNIRIPQEQGKHGELGPWPEVTSIGANFSDYIAYACCNDGKVCSIDLTSGQCADGWCVMRPHSKKINSCLVRNGGNQFVTASDDGTAKVFDSRSLGVVRTINPLIGASRASDECEGVKSPIKTLASSDSERWLAIGASAGAVTLFSELTGECSMRFPTRMGVRGLLFDGSSIVTAGIGGSIYCHSFANGAYVTRTDTPLISIRTLHRNPAKGFYVAAGDPGNQLCHFSSVGQVTSSVAL